MGMGKNLLIWIAVFVIISMGSAMFGADVSKATAEKLAFSEFMDKVENKQISEVTISGA
ncbi:MAG: ATP-dependent metallopeptidase FtsH/Yme1/Tma family protein [Alphaproteobacteria bacterium]|nr:ATP-dependent metallopeptidase FtsH/Yme1/Tma family protein [Alphaproteobacteria bacterium]